MDSLSVALVVVRAFVMLSGAVLLVLVLRTSSASLRRHVLLLGALSALLLPPASWALAGHSVVEVLPPRTVAHVVAEALSPPAIKPSSLAPQPSPDRVTRGEWSKLIPAIWVLGTVTVLLHTLIGLLSARRLAESARGSGEVRVSADVPAPVAVGVLSPVILLPLAAETWSAERRAVVLLHERSHVRERDGLWLLVARLVCALYWFLPPAWWVLARMRRECELLADEAVLSTGVRPSAYAEHLLAIARTMHVPVTAVAMAARPSELGRRVELLVSRSTLPRRLSRAGASFSAVLALALVALAACTATPGVPSPATPAHAAHAAQGTDGTAQAWTTEEAERARAEWGARRVAIVVLDARSGAILANSDDQPAAAVVPASTLKPLTVAVALEAGSIAPEQRFDCGNGKRAYGERTLSDAGQYGPLTPGEILAVSSNVGTSRIFDAVGGARLGAGLARFHVDVPADLETSSLRGAIIAMGEGSTTTPLALARAYRVLANDGIDDGAARVVSVETARKVRTMLEGVVTGERATGRAAAVAGARVGGKTGTSDEEDCENCAPTHGLFASFVGIAPIDRPRYVIYVGVGEPAKTGTGGTIAAPVFSRLATRLLSRGG
jgi:beta-lactamase regulating signal transducer with metallopeptidase domain